MTMVVARRAVANFAAPAQQKTAKLSPTAAGVAEVKGALKDEWLAHIYRERILQMRTRAHTLIVPPKENRIEIQHTLLGVELKVGRQRMMCPDLATARYLSVFARAGCTAVAVPYDISLISRLADELESSWQRMLLLIERATADRTNAFRSRLRSTLIRDAREEIAATGAGAAIPRFNQNTKQRRA